MYYPIGLNLKNKNILIIGGGNIAKRKLRGLLNKEANIVILAKNLNFEIPEDVKYIKGIYEKEYIKNADLVFAATDSKEINKNIVKDCNSLNILVNDISNYKNSDFINLAQIKSGGINFTIDTGGAFPSLTKKISKEIKEEYKIYDEETIELLRELRALVLNRYYEERLDIFKKALDLNKKELKKLIKDLGGNMVIVGTRGSDLAVTQTGHVIDMLKEKNPEIEFKIKTIKTTGDIMAETPISELGGKEIFIKEIEKSLLEGEIDLAIHSMKDVPGELPKGLTMTYVPKREDHRDVLVLREGLNSLEDLPKGAKIGTGSKRRKFQLLEYRDDLEIVSIRGNVQTRINRIENENLDGVVVAKAGVNRLKGQLEWPGVMIDLEDDIMLASPTQGILGIEIREGDSEIEEIIKTISDEDTEIQNKAERRFLKAVGGSCKVPVGAYLTVARDDILLKGLLGNDDGKLVKDEIRGKIGQEEEIAQKLADKLIKELENER